MSPELREIINKMISENPDIIAIYSDWKPSLCDGFIFVQIPDVDENRIINFCNYYNKFIVETYGKNLDFEGYNTSVMATASDLSKESMPCVYRKEV